MLKAARVTIASDMREFRLQQEQGPGEKADSEALKISSETSSATSLADAIQDEVDRNGERIYDTISKSPWSKPPPDTKPKSTFRVSKTVTPAKDPGPRP